MCELFAMSARLPTNVRVSLDELARHGGRAQGAHRDGWGIAFGQEGDALVIREPGAAGDSECLAFLQRRNIRSSLVVAHIRKATQGRPLLRNSQPFTRELGGVAHVFAHNGMLPGIETDTRFTARRFLPIGDTDSEFAFCALLERMAGIWRGGLPSIDERLAEVVSFAEELRSRGPANFVYADGDAVFAHGHRRKNDAGVIAPPGLHVLCRTCGATSDGIELAGVSWGAEPDQRVALLASVPLSNERWEPLGEGEVVVLREGRIVLRHGLERRPPQAPVSTQHLRG